MKTIADLAKILTKYSHLKIEIWSPKAVKAGNRDAKVVNFLSQGGEASDKAVAKLLSMDEHSSNFYVYKHRLKEKIYGGLLSIDFAENEFSNYGRAFTECSRNAYIVRLLLHKSLINAAVELAGDTLKMAAKYELADIALFCAQTLRLNHSIAGQKKEYRHYDEECKKYLALLNDEETINQCLEQLYVTHVNRNAYTTDDVKEARELLAKLETAAGHTPRYQAGLNLYRAKGIVFLFERDFAAALDNWAACERHIEKYRDFEFENRMGELAIQRLECCLNMRDFEKGKQWAGQCRDYLAEDNINRLFAHEYFFLLAMHTQNHDEAGTVLNDVFGNPGYDNLGKNKQEKWELYNGYYHLLLKSGQAAKAITAGKKSGFKINKFISDANVYNKDKRGHNTAILILQVLFLLADKKSGRVSGMIESLQRYITRHLEKDSFYRSMVFIEMICIAEKCGFNREQTHEKTKDLYAILLDPAYAYSSAQEGMEVIPYEIAWNMMF